MKVNFLFFHTVKTYLEAHTGFCMNSNSLSFSKPLKTLFWGVLPGNKSLVMVSSGLSGNQTRRAQMETRLAKGSHNSLPSTLMPDLKVPIENVNKQLLNCKQKLENVDSNYKYNTLPRDLEFSPFHRSMNSLISFASLEGLITYMSSFPWPTLWYRLMGL